METDGQTFPSGTVTPWLGTEGWAPHGGSATFDEYPFELGTNESGTKVVKSCRLLFGRIELKCDDTPINWESDGEIYAAVKYSSGSAKLEVRKGQSTPASTITESFRTVYKIHDGTIVDFRMMMPVMVAAN